MTVVAVVGIRPVLPVLTVKVSLEAVLVPVPVALKIKAFFVIVEFETVPALEGATVSEPLVPSMVTLSITIVEPEICHAAPSLMITLAGLGSVP